MAKTGNPSIGDTRNQGMTNVPDTTNAYKAEATNARKPMGRDALSVGNRTTDTAGARLEPRKNNVPDPLGMTGGKGIRRGVPVRSQSHGIVAKLPGPGSEAQPTLANGKILPPTHSQSGNFYASNLEGRPAVEPEFPKGSWRPPVKP